MVFFLFYILFFFFFPFSWIENNLEFQQTALDERKKLDEEEDYAETKKS